MSVVTILKKTKDVSKYDSYSTGRRKRSVARLWVRKKGNGEFAVNGINLKDYFHSDAHLHHIMEPFSAIKVNGTSYDIRVTVKGGGLSGQSGAIRHALSRALVLTDEMHRPDLRKSGMLTRDPREVERKKPGQSGARKKYQFSKR